MKLDELKKMYDGKSIGEIESAAQGAREGSETQHQHFISLLFYLQNSSRFRENVAYKKATFAQYIMGVYALSIQTYERSRLAYFKFPTETAAMGPGAVMKIVSRCGQETAPKVFREVMKDKKPSPEKVAIAIAKFATPVQKAAQARPSYADLERDLVAEKKKNQELSLRLKEVTEQRDKLVLALSKVNTAVKGIVPIGMVESQKNVAVR